MKGKTKKKIAYAVLAASIVAFCIGAYLKSTVQDDPPMSAPDWWEKSRENSDREFRGFALMIFGGFFGFASVQELVRQAMKLKIPKG